MLMKRACSFVCKGDQARFVLYRIEYRKSGIGMNTNKTRLYMESGWMESKIQSCV